MANLMRRFLPQVKCHPWMKTELRNLESISIGSQVRLSGWIKSVRPVSNDCTFMTLSDCLESIQLVFNSHLDPKAAPTESAVEISGRLQSRPAVSCRHDLKNGFLEVVVDEFTLLNKADPLPIIFSESAMPCEELRLKHRYLDLRRPEMQNNIRFRSAVVSFIRQEMEGLGFTEIETPILFKSTPEGAAEFTVDKGDGLEYALPQSPQQFKQLLAASGFDRYFQIAKCFRNEDLRADRQPEFTQLDIEMGFAGEDHVRKVIEMIVSRLWTNFLGMNATFQEMSFQEAMSRFGSDKPDIRLGYEIQTLDSVGSAVTEKLSLSDKLASDALIKEFETVLIEGTLAISIERSNEAVHFIVQRDVQASPGLTLLGKIRLLALRSFAPKAIGSRFIWIHSFPLFTLNSGKLESMHHLFTAPHSQDISRLTLEPLSVRGLHYDLVLDGVEIGGGSVRIHDARLQEMIMRDCLKLSNEKLELFRHLLDALKCGAPPHAGIALGLDRLIALMVGAQNIRDVIAFPKSASGHDLLFKCPTLKK